MKVLIIEDEKPAARRLERLVLDQKDGLEILAKLDSVKSSINWFNRNAQPDLIFMDIQLADGLSFEIFEHVKITSPIIFTTAYDEYALKAFKVNSIDYLLKPIDEQDLNAAFDKLNQLRVSEKPGSMSQINSLEQITQAVQMLTRQYKNRFVIKIGEHIKTVSIDEIHYFFSRDKATYCATETGKNYLLDYPIQDLINKVDPEKFFQINRKYIITLRAIKDMVSFSNSRLKIILHNSDDDNVIVSRERVQDFKQWLDG
ncbi:MAG: LytTR family DNA-binding domain-containing protein [Bacteroidota bacterium]